MPNLRIAKHPALPVAKHSHQKIFDNSTDREMAVAIGLYIIGLQRDLTTFIEDRIATNGHSGLSSRIAREEALAQQAVNQRDRLLGAIVNAADSSMLIRALHREFLANQSKEAN